MFSAAPTILPDEELPWLEKIGMVLLIPLAISIFFAPLFYWLIPKVKIRNQRKKATKKLFTDFIERHKLKVTGDGYVYGIIDAYTFFMHAEYDIFQSKKWIEIQVIFNPMQNNQYIEESLLLRLQRKYAKENVTYHTNCLLIKQVYSLRMPKYDILHTLLKRCISDLKGFHIEPIRHEQWIHTIPETQEHLNTLKKL
jgi:hypothetical protein